MPETDIPILVVDDAKFSSAVIAKVLRSGGLTNVRFTNNPQEALRSLEKRSAELVLADWLMPAMDGMELTRRIRRIDADNDHFTYVMLMTPRAELDDMQTAFDAGVDDFLSKADIRAQLLPRVLAATRIAMRQNDLVKNNKHLQRKVKELQTTDLVDPVTGLGNLKFTTERLEATLKQSESRGGTACLLLIGVHNMADIRNLHDQNTVDELMSGLAAKVRNLVRPTDLVTRPEQDIFAVVTLQESMQNCRSQSFKRIFDNLYMHSLQTNDGFIPVVVGVSICAADASTGFPTAKDFLRLGYDSLARSFDTGTIHVQPFDPSRLMNLSPEST